MPEAKLELRLIDQEDQSDVQFVYDTRFHPDVYKHLMNTTAPGASFPPSFESHRQWLRACVPEKRLMFLLWHDGKRVGYCHAYDFLGKDTVEIGFVVHPQHQGKGYGKQAVELLVKQLRSTMKEKRIILYVRKENIRAIDLYRKFGFVEVPKNENCFELPRRD